MGHARRLETTSTLNGISASTGGVGEAFRSGALSCYAIRFGKASSDEPAAGTEDELTRHTKKCSHKQRVYTILSEIPLAEM